MNVKRFASIDTLSRAAADQLAMLASRGPCSVALSGGSTPKRMFQILAERGRKALAWDNVDLWWGDERCVPPDHPDSNYGMTRANLIDPLGLDLDRTYRIEGEIDPDRAAHNYEQTLAMQLGKPPVFDLVLLGMGPDGHTASLFPGSPGLDETERYVIANRVDSPLTKGPATRITLTYPALDAAKRVLFLVAGADKADTLQKVLEGPPGVYPSQRVAANDITWFVDDAAAAKLGQKGDMILAGDIGGTKTTLALCDDNGAVTRDQTVASADQPSLEAIIDLFAPGSVRCACFGVAGPVVEGVAKITNLPWTIATTSLTQKLGGARVSLLNDLQATALGALVVSADKFAVLQAGKTATNGTIAVIAPGTGLGEATLYHDGERYRALPSEGGHADLAPGTDEEIELLKFLRDKYRGHVSNERVLCGNGFGDLYAFCRKQLGTPEPAWLTAELAAGDDNAVVSKAGLAGKDDACKRAVELFVQILGAEAGNLALRGLALGGVVIGGGIPPKILPALQTGALIDRFNAKGRFHDWAAGLSVRVLLEPRAALYGAAHQAAST